MLYSLLKYSRLYSPFEGQSMSSIYSFFMAACYDAAMRRYERLCLGGWRRELLAPLSGTVLEIGAGTGINIPCYPADLTSLVLGEPDAHMRRKLQKRVDRYGRTGVRVSACGAEKLPFADDSFDAAVSTLVLCSVQDIDRTLNELLRVLRPGGTLVVLEHVGADGNSSLARWQRRLEPAWRCLAGNCHLTRDTEERLAAAGFILDLESVAMHGAPPVVGPMIKGTARKPHTAR